ncbi:MAG: DTW domain-containing protein [Bdellovibrionales bacterium]|nr:DTW domain-containing protein [Bdellovibrionales bacterium]
MSFSNHNQAPITNTPHRRAKDPVIREYDGRCHECYMRIEKCICDLVPEIDNKSFLTVIMHHRESYKTTNSARIACMALKNSQILLRGLKGAPLILPELDSASDSQSPYNNTQPVLLTLNERSELLTPEFVRSFNKPLHLIVPDGNWGQASRVGKREPSLQNIPWVKLAPGAPSCYKLRHEHHPEGLSTLEAIARAFAVIESPSIEDELMKIFNVMVERTLETRPSRGSHSRP